jgi:glutamate-1-semialdehyde 2,1-aminomutase
MSERAATTRSAELFERANELMPGGVSSPVRAFRRVGGEPFFATHGAGVWLHDADGNRYIDYVMSWGALMLGHAHPAIVGALHDTVARGTSFGTPSEGEVVLAELVREMMPAVEMVRFVNSGTEATMSALRLARAVTGRDLVLKFSGCYHGHGDAFLVQAGSGVATLGLPDSPGVPAALAALTITAPYNDLDAVRAHFERDGERIACIIVEPVCGNAGYIPPQPGFLQGLREITQAHDALLVFDEVMTGFRVAAGGAQSYFRVTPDLTTLGKVIGGGLPVGAYGGRRDLMERIAPSGPVYQAGTLSGNPLAMAAGIAQLTQLRDADPYDALHARTTRLVDGFRSIGAEQGIDVHGGALGAMGGWFFHDRPVHRFEDARASDTERFARFFRAALTRGVFLPPSPFEALFLCTAHTEDVIDDTLDRLRDALRETTS